MSCVCSVHSGLWAKYSISFQDSIQLVFAGFVIFDFCTLLIPTELFVYLGDQQETNFANSFVSQDQVYKPHRIAAASH